MFHENSIYKPDRVRVVILRVLVHLLELLDGGLGRLYEAIFEIQEVLDHHRP